MEKAEWVKAKPEEIKEKVIELARQGKTPAEIGLILRDQHGIPKTKLFGMKIQKIIKEAGIETNYNLNWAKNKVENLENHFNSNKHDYKAKQSLIKRTSLLRKLQR